ncbi:cupin domain-containing protein [Mangrovimonas aestuarii]|uniref:hypothetical protein n=1 Tax=Mangrovimonas aestuarii TaxID=3018443 RepID=UPI002378A0A5|nr:hypothetical protein [Mangrovimonas aestuarii]
MKNHEIERLIGFNIQDKLEYISNVIVVKHILNEKEDDIVAIAVDYGEVYKPKPISFPTYIKVLEGRAEVVIDNVSDYLDGNGSMIIPADKPFKITANQRFKMLSIILKNLKGL